MPVLRELAGCMRTGGRFPQLRCLVITADETTSDGISQARILEWVAISFSRGDLPDPGMEPGSPALQADSLLSEPQGNSFSLVNGAESQTP